MNKRWKLISKSGVLIAKRLFSLAAVAAAVLGLLVAVQKVPEWQVNRARVHPAVDTRLLEIANLQNEMRKTFVQVVGGVFVVLALYLTYRRTRVTEQGHITDRYTKAIEQLGAIKTVGNDTKPNIEVRLGAIYALERIAVDSPRDHWTVIEVLTAYVRENAPAQEPEQSAESNTSTLIKGPTTEIQAILTVLGRRRRDRERGSSEQWLDLRKSSLRGASLFRAHLEDINFSGALLQDVRFFGAHMEGAKFIQGHIEGAYFSEAHLEGAIFNYAHVERANFSLVHAEGSHFEEARVEGAFFSGSHMEGAHFNYAQLEEANFIDAYIEGASFYGANVEKAYFFDAKGLTVDQIKKAKGWEKAFYNEAFAQELGLTPQVVRGISDGDN